MSTNNHRKCAKCGKTRIEDMTVTYHRFPYPGPSNIAKWVLFRFNRFNQKETTKIGGSETLRTYSFCPIISNGTKAVQFLIIYNNNSIPQ